MIIKVRTSVTLPKDLLLRVDAFTGKKHKRSAVIESALRDFLQNKERAKRDPRELEIINANADLLNQQAAETLEFLQAKW